MRSQLRPFGGSIENSELLAQGQVFSHDFKARRKEATEKAKQSREEAQFRRCTGRMGPGTDAVVLASRAPLNTFFRRGTAIIPTEFLPARVSTFQAISIS